MKLNHFTDFSMRVLIQLNHTSEKKNSLDGLTQVLNISRNHLIKVVQFLSKNNLVETQRGKNGGIKISENARKIKLGDLIDLLEQDKTPIINCKSKPCLFFNKNCRLKLLFNEAYDSFLLSLNQYTIMDLMFENWNELSENI